MPFLTALVRLWGGGAIWETVQGAAILL
jgi:hypothetical protein